MWFDESVVGDKIAPIYIQDECGTGISVSLTFFITFFDKLIAIVQRNSRGL